MEVAVTPPEEMERLMCKLLSAAPFDEPRRQASQNKTRGTDHPAAEPMIYPTYLPTQNAIDRARTSAQSGMRRAKADLDKMQAPRKSKPAAVPQIEPNPVPVTPESPEPEAPAPTIRTQSHPPKRAQQARPSLCPCNSGREFIDCCAAGDGPASQKAA
jgi:SEC-C motif